MRGRLPAGLEYIDKLDGAVEDKERLKAILETMFGIKRLVEIGPELDLGETRLHQLREVAMQGALDAIVRRPAGRPCRAAASEAEQIRVLQQRIEELELAVHEAQVRAEIALVLPQVHLVAGEGKGVSAEAVVGKKTRRRRVKLRKPR